MGGWVGELTYLEGQATEDRGGHFVLGFALVFLQGGDGGGRGGG